MHILPPEEPRRPSNASGDPPYEPQSQDARARHYHYHAAADAEERLRRDAVRDYLYDELIKHDARRRLRFKIALCLIFVGIVMMFVLSRTGPNGSTASNGNTAVEVSSEYRDGKWVATAQRVPTPFLPVRPLDSYAGYAPGSQDSTTQSDVPVPIVTDEQREIFADPCVGNYREATPQNGQVGFSIKITNRPLEVSWIFSDFGSIKAVNEEATEPGVIEFEDYDDKDRFEARCENGRITLISRYQTFFGVRSNVPLEVSGD